MAFLWIAVDDEPGPGSMRGYLERSIVALLGNSLCPVAPVDPPSALWLGRWAASDAVRRSGLWNANHVAEACDPAFLYVLKGRLS